MERPLLFPICTQGPTQCFYCRKGVRAYKKKLASKRSNKERVCKKCGKEFLYPSKLEQHLANKTPCIFSSNSSTISRSSSVSNSTISRSLLGSSTINRSSASSFKEKNSREALRMVPIHLSLVQD